MPENSKSGLGLQLATPFIGRTPVGYPANRPTSDIQPRHFVKVASRTDNPTVSVVVPFYGTNVSALTKCVESLSDQDYPQNRITIIVIDNNESPTLLPSMFGERCKLFHEPRPGSYAARNRGLSQSSDHIIAFTDSDCVPQRSWISAGVRTFMEAGRPVIVGGRIAFSFGSEIARTDCELLDSIIHHRQSEYVSEHGFAATANLFVPRALISSHGQFDVRFLGGGDREFGQRLTASGVGIVMANDAVVVHPARIHFIDLLQKGLRGVGGEKTLLTLRKSSPWAIFKIQINNYLHRQRLISNRADALAMAPYRLVRLRALLTLIYVARLLEAIRLALGGRPCR
jgi:glycosyltransferase involved in cell wall biosynthesis